MNQVKPVYAAEPDSEPVQALWRRWGALCDGWVLKQLPWFHTPHRWKVTRLQSGDICIALAAPQRRDLFSELHFSMDGEDGLRSERVYVDRDPESVTKGWVGLMSGMIPKLEAVRMAPAHISQSFAGKGWAYYSPLGDVDLIYTPQDTKAELEDPGCPELWHAGVQEHVSDLGYPTIVFRPMRSRNWVRRSLLNVVYDVQVLVRSLRSMKLDRHHPDTIIWAYDLLRTNLPAIELLGTRALLARNARQYLLALRDRLG